MSRSLKFLEDKTREPLGIDYLYKFYSQAVKDEKKKLKEKLISLKKSQQYLCNRLEFYVPYITSYKLIGSKEGESTNKKVDNKNPNFNPRLAFKNLIYIKHVTYEFPLFLPTDRINPVKYSHKDVIEFLLGRLIQCNRYIQSIKNRLEILKEVKLNEQLYKAVIKKINSKFLEAIVKDGYKYNIYGVGSYSIIVLGKNTPINWKASYDRKKLLEENGVTPYKAEKDQNGKIIGDNGGEKWFVNYSNDNFYLLAFNAASPFNYLKSNEDNEACAKFYNFIPAQGTMRYVQRTIEANPLLHHKYQKAKNYERVKNNIS